MGSSSSTTGQPGTTSSIVCKLVVDNKGQFAGLAPVEVVNVAEGRAEAFNFAETLVASIGKEFNPKYHRLKIPSVPADAIDIGLHSSTHNAKFNGGPLSPEQVQRIENCTDTFTMTVDLRDFKVLVGMPSNDEATGVIGYVGLLFAPESLSEYNRAVAVYGGKPCYGNIPHVSICGWEFKDLSTTTEARAAFGLTTADSEKYPDGRSIYTANVFPSLTLPESSQ